MDLQVASSETSLAFVGDPHDPQSFDDKDETMNQRDTECQDTLDDNVRDNRTHSEISPQETLFYTAIHVIRRVLPSTFVSTAFWLTIHSLGTCDMAVLRRSDDSKAKSIFFGLWSFSDPAEQEENSDSMFYYYMSPTGVHEGCQFQLGSNDENDQDDNESLASLLVVDGFFKVARASAIIVVTLGFVCMVILWAAVFRESMFPKWWRKWLGVALMVCCIMEGFTLLIFASSTCRRGFNQHCRMAQGVAFTILSSIFWFLSLLSMLMWPKAQEAYGEEVALTWTGFWNSMESETRHPSKLLGYTTELQQTTRRQPILQSLNDEISFSGIHNVAMDDSSK